MRISFSLFAVAALMTMAACNDDADFGNDTLAQPQPLVFVATQDAMTASDTRAAAADTWDGGEEIAIKIGDEVKKYKIADTNGTLELDASTTPFYRSDRSDIDVKAWYPYSDSEPTTPDVATDQSKDQESGNLMKATATAKFGESTSLVFKHQTARIRLHLYKDGTTDDLTGATVKVKVTNGTGQTEKYTAHEDGKGYYSVLVVPGSTISSGADFVSITDGNVGPYKATAPADATFDAGKSYTYDFNLKSNPYITFSAASEQGFKMTLPTSTVTELGTFEYSVGDGEWTTITSGMGFVKFGGSNGDLKLRGISKVGTYISTISFENDNVPVVASGDIRTLVDYENYKTVDTGSAMFSSLFKNCTSLKSAPALPATTLAKYCYYSMFSGCTSLTVAPDLPATTLANGCYHEMFSNCSSLAAAPDLPATTLAKACYEYMFYGCKSLASAPALPATTLAEVCYFHMFVGCTSLTSAPALPATTLANGCYHSMFSGCTSLAAAPDLPATTLAKSCYEFMFDNCTSLTSAPKLPVTTLAECCYAYMFNGCISLTSAPALPAQTLTYRCYGRMFSGCISLIKAPALSATTLAESCYDGMFYGCTSLNAAPELPATTLAKYCYYSMFEGCTSLTSASALPATTLAESCYDSMFSGCTSLTEAPKLPATTLAEYCYNEMFSACTSLNAAPALPATTIAEYCYANMFEGCTLLTAAPALSATTLAENCYASMFNGCSSLTEAPELSATTLAENCYASMFKGCSSLTEAPELSATTLAKWCYESMFNGCSSLNSVTIKAEITAEYAFDNWLEGVASKGTIYKKSTLTLPAGASGIPYGWDVKEITE